MTILLVVTAIACAALLIALVRLIRNVAAAAQGLPVTTDWIDELSIERYRPMMRLLDTRDLEFLREQPGFTPETAAKLRLQRCQIFQGYLRCLSADFGRICGAIRILMMQSNHDRPDLAAVLLRHQVLFACGLLTVNGRLMLYRAGWCGVDVTRLLGVFDVMRLELKTLVPASSAMSA